MWFPWFFGGRFFAVLACDSMFFRVRYISQPSRVIPCFLASGLFCSLTEFLESGTLLPSFREEENLHRVDQVAWAQIRPLDS